MSFRFALFEFTKMNHAINNNKNESRRTLRSRRSRSRAPKPIHALAKLAFKIGVISLVLAGIMVLMGWYHLFTGRGDTISTMLSRDLDAFQRAINVLAWYLFALGAFVAGSIAFLTGHASGKYLVLGALSVFVLDSAVLWVPLAKAPLASVSQAVRSIVDPDTVELVTTTSGTTSSTTSDISGFSDSFISTIAAAEVMPQTRAIENRLVEHMPVDRSADLSAVEVANVSVRADQTSVAPLVIERVDHLPVTSTMEKLAAMPSEQYTIQLLATDSEYDAIEYITRHQLRDALYFRVDKSQGGQYKLILGQYETFEQVSVATANLNDALRKYSPWIRQFKSIQQQLGMATAAGEDDIRASDQRNSLKPITPSMSTSSNDQ
jgi:hypothetical protein